MPLDPQVQQLLNQHAASGAPDICQLTPDEARRQMLDASKLLGPPDETAGMEERSIDGPTGEISVRIYRGHQTGNSIDARPTVVYFHGGGWVIGSVATHDNYCRSLANAAGAVIVSVDYRLAPEHRFPAALDDCYAATVWAAANTAQWGSNAGRLLVAGDSAGGNLAAAVALAARDRQGPSLAGQVLIYPITDHQFGNATYNEFAQGYFLTRTTMQWFWDQYVPVVHQRDNQLVSPLRAEDLANLPPALVITAEYDPLRDEGEAFADRLAHANVSVKLERYKGMIHGFVRRTGLLAQAQRALALVADFVRVGVLQKQEN